MALHTDHTSCSAGCVPADGSKIGDFGKIIVKAGYLGVGHSAVTRRVSVQKMSSMRAFTGLN